MAEENTNVEAPEAPASGGDSSRDDVARAFDEVQSREAPPPDNKATPSPVRAPDVPPGERLRGPDGRYLAEPAPKPLATPPGAPPAAARPAPGPGPLAQPAAKPNGATPPQEAPQALRAPTSWKPGVREHWAKLPPEVQQEVVRREGEVARAMQESARFRETLGQVQGILGPFAANFAASEGGALGAMQQLFRADHTLRHGSLAEKAQLAADIVKNYGVDIRALDAALAGQELPNDPNAQLASQLRREMQQQLQPVLGFFNQVQGRQQAAFQQINEKASGEVQSFGEDGAHEFFEDVRNDMADIIDFHTARGQVISLQEAYDRAINFNPQLREVVAKRAESERANAAAAAAQRARRTAASISSAPAPAGGVPGPANDDRRAAIEAAWNDSEGR